MYLKSCLTPFFQEPGQLQMSLKVTSIKKCLIITMFETDPHSKTWSYLHPVIFYVKHILEIAKK